MRRLASLWRACLGLGLVLTIASGFGQVFDIDRSHGGEARRAIRCERCGNGDRASVATRPRCSHQTQRRRAITSVR